MQMEPLLTYVPAFLFISSSLFSALFGVFFPLGISPRCISYVVQVQELVEAEHRERTLVILLPVLDPLSCVLREIAVVLIIVVKFLLAASFLCEILLL